MAAVPGEAHQIKNNEPKRVELYKSVSALVRAYGAVANDMDRAGYAAAEAKAIKEEIAHYVAVKNEVEVGAGENIDMKKFEAGMRALLDTYIQADPVEQIATFDKGLVQLIVERGADAIDTLPEGIKRSPEAVAETIINNVRKTIVDERAMNPKYYDRMSLLLDALIQQRHLDSIEYAEFLAKLLEHAEKIGKGESEAGVTYPLWASTAARRALVDFAWPPGVEIEVERLHGVIQNAKEHGWVGNPMKERALARALRKILPESFDEQGMKGLIDRLKEHDEYR